MGIVNEIKIEVPTPLHIVFEGPPPHKSGSFVECEDENGKSVNAGRWEQRGEFWHLIIETAHQ